ncbi:hypothetical protein DTO021C3_6924 [Paecilomyces variotii]|nr:hypothetical protein DTO021C3_6924 [Paecilomyces variotii]
MATATSGIDRKPSISGSGAVRSSTRYSQQTEPSSPHTPRHSHHRSILSFSQTSTSSPGSSFRNEEDAVIFEFGTRWLRAGFEGDSAPICKVGFGPEESRKAGDYRGWIKTPGGGNAGDRKRSMKAEEWTRRYELWRMDLRDVDLALVDDKIERAVREIYNNYLLTDAGNSRLVLVIPSIVPHPLLSSVLSTLFNRWRYPSITLLPSPTMAAVAAGLRSALVVDLGWAETTVTGLYEYREIETKRSTRGMKLLMQEMGRFLTALAEKRDQETDENDRISVGFDYCEEVVSRFAWCKLRDEPEPSPDTPRTPSFRMASIPSPSNPSVYIEVPFSRFADQVDIALFAEGVSDWNLDDQEKPIDELVYRTLLALPPDVRGSCMSRIIFTGGGANIPGIRRRILQDVSSLVRRYGWSSIRGRVIDEQRKKLQGLSINQQSHQSSSSSSSAHRPPSSSSSVTIPDTFNTDADHIQQEELDFVEQKLRRTRKDLHGPPVHGIFRQVDTLGPWAGASLVASMKLRGLVEIEREKFLQHGLAGASRDSDAHVPDRRSGLRAGDRSSWTLAGWG